MKEGEKDNPCWDGYEMVGTKMKDGKEVPNCVPKNETIEKMVDDIVEGTQPAEVLEAWEPKDQLKYVTPHFKKALKMSDGEEAETYINNKVNYSGKSFHPYFKAQIGYASGAGNSKEKNVKKRIKTAFNNLQFFVKNQSEVREMLSHDEVIDILDVAAQFSDDAHTAADVTWKNKDALVKYLLSDHIPKKYHSKFKQKVK